MRKYLSIFLALLAVGCVDESIDVLQVGGNVGIGAENLAVPLGYLPEKSLGEIISDQVDNLVVDPVTGDYSLAYNAETESLTIDGSGNGITLPGQTFDMAVDYPSFKLPSAEMVIDDVCYMGGNYNGFSILLGQSVYCPVDGLQISGEESGVSSFNFEVTLPKYVTGISRIYTKHDPSLPGAPIDAHFDLGCLGDINGGGTLSLSLALPEGCEAYDEDFNLITNGIFSVENRQFGSGAQVMNFRLYVKSITNNKSAENGLLDLSTELKYSIAYSISSKAGTTVVESLPTLGLSAHIVCEDAEVVLGAMDIMEYAEFMSTMSLGALDDSIANIKSLKNIDFTQSQFRLFVDKLGNWNDDALLAGALDDILVEVTLPKSFVISVDNSGVEFDATNNRFSTSLAELHRGVNIALHQINFGEEGLVPKDGENLELDIIFGVRVALKSGASIRLQHLQQDGFAVRVGYDRGTLVVASVTGRVDFSYKQSTTIDIASIVNSGDIEIKGLGVSPVVDFTLSNSLTLPLYVNASIVPVHQGVESVKDALEIDRFEISAATVGSAFNDVIPATTNIRLGKNLTPEQGVTTIECDLERLLNGALPESLKIDLVVATDPNSDVSLTILPQYPIEYSYGFSMPLAFGSALDLSYSGVMTGVGETVGDLGLDVSATGRVGLVCEVENTIPLNLALELEFLDESGCPTALQLKPVGEGVVRGSADGKTACKSTIGFALESENKNLIEQLLKVADLRYKLRATSASSGVALNCNQSISATISLEVDGNIGVNLDFEEL